MSERIVEHLHGRRWFWIAVWALVPWVNALVNLSLDDEERSAVWHQGTTAVLLSYAALSLAVAVTVWGAAELAERLERLAAEGEDVLEGAPAAFRAPYEVAGPLVGACLMAVARPRDVEFPLDIRSVTGRARQVRTRPSRQDWGERGARPLRPFGDIAFLGLWLLLAWLVPVVWTSLSDVVGFVIGMLALAIGLAVFFLSLARLHRRMVEAKGEELRIARALYAEAYEPVRRQPTAEMLEQQRSFLGRRRRARETGSADPGTADRRRDAGARVTVATSVVAVTIARLLLDPFGL